MEGGHPRVPHRRARADHPGPELGATRDLVARVSARLHRCRADPARPARRSATGSAACRPGWTTPSSWGVRAAAGAGLRVGDTRLRHVDHFRIDPRLGDDADFDALVAPAHERGLRIMLDGVFNHVGRGFHAAFAGCWTRDPRPTASWFRLRWPETPPTAPGTARLRRLRGPPPARRARPHAARRGRPRRRGDEPLARPRVPTAGGSTPRTPCPRSSGRRSLHRVRARHPDAYLVGEVIHGDYAAFVRDGRPRRGHPVRAVEGGLELAQRPQLLRARPRPGPARRVPRRTSCR